jgi:hypothetical protein
MSVAVPQEIASFREDYRAREIGPRYSGWLHFCFTTFGCISVVAFAISRVHAVRPVEWAVVPASFLLANVAEYFGHRGPMHRPRPLLGLIYKRHTLEHHHYFTRQAMSYESTRDFKMVLFPPVMLLFFLGALATPISLGFYLLVSPNAGWIFAATGVSYYLTYEWLHFAYHLPPETAVGRLGIVRVLRRHHAAHHDLSLMGKWNFNVTFPIADWVFRTLYRAS